MNAGFQMGWVSVLILVAFAGGVGYLFGLVHGVDLFDKGERPQRRNAGRPVVRRPDNAVTPAELAKADEALRMFGRLHLEDDAR